MSGSFIGPPALTVVYAGYPVPRPLMLDQTFGCTCWAGRSPANQALAADPVNTATGGMTESFTDLTLAGTGIGLQVSRTYNSLDEASGPLGQGWSFAYGASLVEDGGLVVLREGSGTVTRFAPVTGGGYAPVDAAVSAELLDGPGGTRVVRALGGDTMTFDAGGRLVAMADERGDGVDLDYLDGQLTTVTDSLGQTLTFTWDAGTGDAARISGVTASDGRSVAYTHATTAGAKRLTAVVDVTGETTTYAYHGPTGKLSRVTDPLGYVRARNTFDTATGRITSQRDQTGAVTTFAWDEQSETATVTDPTGRTRTDVYSGLNLVRQIEGDGADTERLYDGDNNPAAFVDPAGNLFHDEYDEQGRLVARLVPSPTTAGQWLVVGSWDYDDEDRVLSHTDGERSTTWYTYDGDGLLVSQENPDGGVHTFTYTDGDGGVPANLLASETDPLGRTTSYTYDAAGDLVSRTSPGGGTTTYTYDDSHRLISTTTPGGATTSFTYDPAGRLLTTTDPLGAVTTNAYDAAGRLAVTTDALGRETTYTYDRAGRLTRTKRPGTPATKTSYDAAGRVASTTDERGGVTSYTYDDAGRPLTVTDPLGHVTTNTYDERGLLTSVTDATGATTHHEYDTLGRLAKTTDPDGVEEIFDYDMRGNVVAQRDADYGGTFTTYDAMGRVSSTRDSDGVHRYYSYDLAGQLVETAQDRSTSDFIPGYTRDRTTYDYDLDGNRVSTVDARGNVPGADPDTFTSTVTFDADGRPTASTNPLGAVTETTYDAAGRPVSVTDPLGSTTTTVYDLLGRAREVVNSLGARTRYTYNNRGHLIRVNAPGGRTTRYTYDAAGNLLTMTDPLGRVTQKNYDAAGNVVSLIKPSGTTPGGDPAAATITYAYDEAGRITALSYGDDTPDIAYSYSDAGRLASASRADDGHGAAGVENTYDDKGRLTGVVRSGPAPSTASYTYSSAGRLSGAAWSTGQAVAYNYNSTGQLAAVRPGPGGGFPRVDYGYDPVGNLSSVTRHDPTPKVSAYHYDAAGQMSALTHSEGTTVVADYEVSRDLRGHPTHVAATTLAPGALNPSTTSTLYAYNSEGWLTRECTTANGTTCLGSAPRTAYSYDKAGARKAKTVRTNPGSGTVVTKTTYAYDAADQLLSQSVDGLETVVNTWSPDGTLESSHSDAGTRTYVTDLAGKVTAVGLEDDTDVAFSYDPSGNRTLRTIDGQVDAAWVWDETTDLPVRIGEYGSGGQLSQSWLPDPTSIAGSVLGSRTPAGAVSWHLADPFTNTIAHLPATGGGLSGLDEMNAFGEVLSTTGTTDQFGFAGQYLDPVTGLYDMRARDYHPSTGRFTAPDAITPPVGMAWVSTYAYAMNNPLVLTDPTGYFPWSSPGAPFWDLEVALKGAGAWAVGVANATVTMIPNTAAWLVNETGVSGAAKTAGLWDGIPYWTAWSNPYACEGIYDYSYTIGNIAGPQILIPGGPASKLANRGTKVSTTAKSLDNLPPGVRTSWSSRVADNGKGTVWQAPGSSGNSNMIRVMEPTERYPNGYVRFYNERGQPIDLRGKAGARNDTHIPRNPDGSYELPAGW